ncbi:MAG: hypothetical protein O7E54_06655 [Planctomycetota bacterium]|nr:hypothetical protein [Planctomycetota bacterium]
MSAESESQVAYDKFWGLVLLITCVVPLRIPDEAEASPVFLWNALAAEGENAGPFQAWLMLGTLAGFVALGVGLVLSARGRGRHAAVFGVAAATMLLPLLKPGLSGSVGSEGLGFAAPLLHIGPMSRLTLIAMLIAYAGSGMRIVRRGQIVALLAGGLGSVLLLLSLFVPLDPDGLPVAFQIVKMYTEFSEHRVEVTMYSLVLVAALLGIFNLIRTRVEVVVAQGTRLLLVSAYLVPVAESFMREGGGSFGETVLPQAWASVRILACALLCFDSLIALLTILITRSND